MRVAGGRIRLEQAAAWAAVAATVLFVLWQLHPSQLISNAEPVLGDLPGHLLTVDQLRHVLLPDGRLQGWSNDGFTGYPVLTFYFPLGKLLVAVLGSVLPLVVALKLVAAVGPLSLPAAAYAYGRLDGRDTLTSACLAVSVLSLLQMEGLIFIGGNIASAAVGEYSYGLALSTGLVVLGLARAGHRSGGNRVLAALLLAATLLLHVVPASAVLLGIATSTVLIRPNRQKLRWSVTVIGTAIALTGFWVVPLLARLEFTDSPEFLRYPVTLRTLLPVGLAPLAVMAFGAVVALSVRLGTPHNLDERGLFLVVMAGLSAVVTAFVPAIFVLNARFLPLWVLFVCLLGGHAVGLVAQAIDDARRRARRGASLATPALARLVAPAVALVLLAPLEDSRLGPGVLHRDPTITVEEYMRGLGAGPHGAEHLEFVEIAREVGRDLGCGRAHWELGGEETTPSGLMHLLPRWTDGCITVLLGLYRESSATTPYILATNTTMPTDIAAGAADLRLLGVRYFVTANSRTRAAADASSHLRRVGQTTERAGRAIAVYEVTEPVTMVEPLSELPAVVLGAGRSREWEPMASAWYANRGDRSVRLVANGPSHWPRIRRAQPVPRQPADVVTVSDVHLTHERVSFRVSQPGTPVLVKVSYFPNWRARGARGPWRATPNHMVVVPTGTNVELRYERSGAEVAGMPVSLLGVVGAALLHRAGPVTMPADETAATSTTRSRRAPPNRGPERKRKKKKKRR